MHSRWTVPRKAHKRVDFQLKLWFSITYEMEEKLRHKQLAQLNENDVHTLFYVNFSTLSTLILANCIKISKTM